MFISYRLNDKFSLYLSFKLTDFAIKYAEFRDAENI